MTSETLQLILESSVSQVEKRRAIRQRMDGLSPKRDKSELVTLTGCLVQSYELQYGE